MFAAELVLTKGRDWHRKCFKCKDCNKTLDSIIACDGPDKDVYCKTCYGKKWGPHGTYKLLCIICNQKIDLNGIFSSFCE